MTGVPIDGGSVIGAYRLIKQIGTGGMGAVWLAEHSMLGRRAAIKVLHPMYSSREDIVIRFFNEARAATAISDPGIVQIFDFGHHTDGSAYIVMELLDGETLDKRQERLGRLPVGDALRILRQVASSLGAAHARGIVHRDLKPENIFLVRDPEVPGGERAKILDFGIAKLTGDQVGVKTQTSAMMGTPLFMSPEQCRGAGGVDQRSDIYALGCVLLTLVTGRPPFDAAGVGELIAMHMLAPPPRATSRVSDVPPAVDDLIAQCLNKDPAHRFPSGTELAAAIGELLAGRFPTPLPFTPHTTGSRTVAPTTTLSGAALSMATPAPSPRRRGLVIASTTVGAIALAGVVTWAVMRAPPSTGAVSAPVAQPIAQPPAAPVTPVTPVTTELPTGSASTVPRDDKPELAAAHIRKAITAFTQWAPSHPAAPCPSVDDLAQVLGGASAFNDPWGHPVAITCTDQPEGQIIGVISAGPDGVLKTHDDVTSWSLGLDATSSVRGARWTATVAPATRISPAVHKPASHSPKRPIKTTTITPTTTTTEAATPPKPPPTTPPVLPSPTPPPPLPNGGIPRSR